MKGQRDLSKEESNVEFFIPIRETLEVRGKLLYNEGDQACTIMRFKKEILQKFPDLKEKDAIYLMRLCESYKELKKEIEKLEKESDAIPIILFIGKERIQNG